MRYLVFVLLLCAPAFAVHPWQEAELSAIETTSADGGSMQLPLNGRMVSVPLRRHYTNYILETTERQYVLADEVNARPLNVTIHTSVKFYLDGTKARLLDEDGKEHKLQLVRKVAKPGSTPEKVAVK